MQAADPFHAIGDPSRREILRLLSGNNMTINDLAGNFEMSRPAVSKHIKLLSEAGFVAITDIGRERHCTLREEGFRVLEEWIRYYDRFWCDKLNNLEKLMDKKEGNQS